ncbi:MAG: acyltransferase [Candidatus Gastranaerophilales bacterium]
MNKLKNYFCKRKILRRAKACGERLSIGGVSKINKNTYLGKRVCFNGMEIMGDGKVTIGNYFHSGVECLIVTQNHNYDNGEHIPYSPNDYSYKDIEIGNCVWLGSRVMILPGTKIGDGAIIQGGSVVHGEIPKYAIAGGNPAKVFKYRNKEHYDRLEKEGKFN